MKRERRKKGSDRELKERGRGEGGVCKPSVFSHFTFATYSYLPPSLFLPSPLFLLLLLLILHLPGSASIDQIPWFLSSLASASSPPLSLPSPLPPF